ncbi:MAG: DMT family transporter [Butyricicoccus sp.]|nr:DMT family transporter [Butyricicoccus sp.]
MKARPLDCLYPAAAACIWGSLYVVSKPALEILPPFTFVLLRYVVALLVLLPLAVRLCRTQGIRIAKEDISTFLFVGIAGYGISTGAQFLGTKLSSASVASLINAMNPVTIAVFAALLLRERITRTQVAALVVVIAGAAIILGDNLGSGQAAGILVSLVSVCLWSLMSVRVRRLGASYPPLLITTVALLIAGVCLIPVSAAEIWVSGGIQGWSWSLLPVVLYTGLICTALSQFCWNKGLTRLEASRCGMFYPLQPVVSTLLGVWILQEPVNARFLIGGVLIVGGIIWNIRSDRPATNGGKEHDHHHCKTSH